MATVQLRRLLIALLAVAIAGCAVPSAPVASAPPSAVVEPAPKETDSPPKPSQKKAIIAVFPGCSPQSSEADREAALALARQLRTKFAAMADVVVVPVTTSDAAAHASTVQGFIGSNEDLKGAAAQLPDSCNILVIANVGPQAASGELPFSAFVARRRDLVGNPMNGIEPPGQAVYVDDTFVRFLLETINDLLAKDSP